MCKKGITVLQIGQQRKLILIDVINYTIRCLHKNMCFHILLLFSHRFDTESSKNSLNCQWHIFCKSSYLPLLPRMTFFYHHLISAQSLNLGGRRDTIDDIATIPFHSSLSSAALREYPNLFPSIPWCYLPISPSAFLSFLLLSLSPAILSSTCQRIFRCVHTIWVSVSLPWLGDHHALQLYSEFCCEHPRLAHGLCRKCSEVSYTISFQGLGSFSRFLLSRSSSHRHKGRWIRLTSASA